MCWRIQVSFQGGGARFIQHLAVAAALQDAEEAGIIEITRVAGTSAGSLAAAILASGISARISADYVKQHRSEFSRVLNMPNSRLYAFYRLMQRKSLVDPYKLKKLFTKFLQELRPLSENQDVCTLAKPIIIAATDLTSRQAVYYGESRHDLVDALVDSCAIPLIYRGVDSLMHGNSIVDGGLVDNLPNNILLKDQHAFGHVVAVSFRESDDWKAPRNVFQYLSLLVDIVAAHNMRNIKRRFDSNLIFEIETRLHPLDFDTAFSDYGVGEAEFEFLREHAWSWICSRARVYKSPPPGVRVHSTSVLPNERELKEIISHLWVQRGIESLYRVPLRRLIIKSSLSYFGDKLKRLDDVYDIDHISPAMTSLYAIPIRIQPMYTSQMRQEQRTIRVKSKMGYAVQSTLMPIGSFSNLSKNTEAILFLYPALDLAIPESYPIQLCSHTVVPGVFQDLIDDNQSFVSLTCSEYEPRADVAEIILILPAECPPITATWRDSDLYPMDIHGFRIPEEELASNKDIEIEAGYRVMGWRAFNLLPKHTFLVLLSFADR